MRSCFNDAVNSENLTHKYTKYFAAEPSYDVEVAAAVCEAQAFCATLMVVRLSLLSSKACRLSAPAGF